MKISSLARVGVILFSLVLGGGYVYSHLNKPKLLPSSKVKILGAPNDLDATNQVQVLPANSQTSEPNLLGGSKSAILVHPSTATTETYIPKLPVGHSPGEVNLLPGSKSFIIPPPQQQSVSKEIEKSRSP